MSYHDPDEPISIVEDLDPEPPVRPGLHSRLELILGVFLLACVLAFVGWQWWHQQAQVSNYAAGQSALADVDWDAALSYFSQAGDYRDAASQAQHAQAQVAERNRLYNSAQHHAANNQWLDSLADVRAAALIQPGYLNLDAQEKTSLQNVYTAALSGTIAMRTNVTPPGLYYYSGTDWVYLQDSDDKSAVFGSDTQGRLIYDVPDAAKGSTPLLASPPYMQVAVSNIRYYRVATLTGNGFPITPSLNLVDIPAQGQPTAGNVETQENATIDNMHTNGDTTAWVANIYPRSGPPDAMLNVYTATLATGTISPTVAFTTTYDPTIDPTIAIPRINLSDNLIAYTLNNQLHVRTYNGSADIALESGVSRISNPTNDVYTLFWNWLK